MDEIKRTFGEVIHTYTRKQAIEDGTLVDVSKLAKEAGIRLPTVLTRQVWGKYVTIPKGVVGQDETGRLWDILHMFRMSTYLFQYRYSQDTILFRLHVRNDNRPGIPPLVTLKAICGPGDQGEPVLTILLPDED